MIRLTRIPMSRREGKDARAYGLVIAEATVPRQPIEATSVRPTRKKADHPHEQERGTSSKISLPPCPTDEGRKRSLSMHKYLRKERTSKKKEYNLLSLATSLLLVWGLLPLSFVGQVLALNAPPPLQIPQVLALSSPTMSVRELGAKVPPTFGSCLRSSCLLWNSAWVCGLLGHSPALLLCR